MSETARDPRPAAVATDEEVAALEALVAMVVDARKGKAAFEALEVQALAAMNALADQRRERLPMKRAVRELPLREIAAEAAFAVRASDRAMQGMIVDAATTVELFPATLTALTAGRISRGHVSALVDAGAKIDDAEARAAFEAAALLVAERESVGRFRAVVHGMSERMNPRTMAERHALARHDRSVRVRDLADGMAELIAIQPAVIAYGIHDRLTQQAKLLQDHARAEAKAAASAQGTAGVAGVAAGVQSAEAPAPGAHAPFEADERTLAQMRADVLADLLLSGAPALDPAAAGDGPGPLGAIRALVQVAVPVLTLAGVEDGLTELDGRVPIDPDTARELASGAPGWDRVLTHPVTGAVLAVDRYTPNADLKRKTSATDRRCRCPGCRQPVHRCDLDHNRPASEGGPTEDGNLSHFCRRHHVLKHLPGWKVRQLPGGRIEWTAPTGRVYIDHPPPRAEYLPDPPSTRRTTESDLDLADRGRAHGPRRSLLPRDGSPPAAPARPVAFIPDGDAAPF